MRPGSDISVKESRCPFFYDEDDCEWYKTGAEWTTVC